MVRPASTKSNQRPPPVAVPATNGLAVLVVLAALTALALGVAAALATAAFLGVAAAFFAAAAAAAFTAVAVAAATAGVVTRLTVPGVGVVDQPQTLPSKAHDWPGLATS